MGGPVRVVAGHLIPRPPRGGPANCLTSDMRRDRPSASCPARKGPAICFVSGTQEEPAICPTPGTQGKPAICPHARNTGERSAEIAYRGKKTAYTGKRLHTGKKTAYTGKRLHTREKDCIQRKRLHTGKKTTYMKKRNGSRERRGRPFLFMSRTDPAGCARVSRRKSGNARRFVNIRTLRIPSRRRRSLRATTASPYIPRPRSTRPRRFSANGNP